MENPLTVFHRLSHCTVRSLCTSIVILGALRIMCSAFDMNGKFRWSTSTAVDCLSVSSADPSYDGGDGGGEGA
eukprot:scaffold59226_cov42-Phaeocystis_antarctica.AAC.1